MLVSSVPQLRPFNRWTLAALLACLSACHDAAIPTAPEAISGATALAGYAMDPMEPNGQGQLSVMTRNMYFGASLDSIALEPNPYEVPVRAYEAWQRVQQTNPVARVRAIAGEIARAAPDVVGLQEVALWRTQSPGDNYPGGLNDSASTVVYDFLTTLMDELRTLGASYEVASVVTDFDIEAVAYPRADLWYLAEDVRLTDRNVILVRSGVPFSGQRSGKYAVGLTLSVGGQAIVIERAWQSVDMMLGGRRAMFVNTHLEQEQSADVQEAQSAELLGILRDGSALQVVVGDMNSAADNHNTRTHIAFLNEGFRDAWKSPQPGFTCCESESLMNARSIATERIDYVLTRGLPESVNARVIGNVPASLAATGGVWPSDHAGVIARLQVP